MNHTIIKSRLSQQRLEMARSQVGIHDARLLPTSDYLRLWDSIILDETIKTRVLSQAILNFTLRKKIGREVIPFHGIILLVGPPGTGKTSLARGLSARTAEALSGFGEFFYLEVDPHALVSSALGKSQKAVTELFRTTIAEHALAGPTIVLLDEVETLAADRMKLSLEANPVDVHRATDAVLVQMDYLAAEQPNLLFIATSNFPKAIDRAFVSRSDMVMEIGLPDRTACREIITSALTAFSESYPTSRGLLRDREFEKVAEACVGLDGREIRKLIAQACTYDKGTALNPGNLTTRDLLKAAHDAVAAKRKVEMK